MIEQGMIQLISQVGFPIVVALYSLTRLEKTVRENTRILTILTEKVGGINDVSKTYEG